MWRHVFDSAVDGSISENIYLILLEDKDEGYEKCIVCGNETEVMRNVHFSQRKNYVSGLGQLCTWCAYECDI